MIGKRSKERKEEKERTSEKGKEMEIRKGLMGLWINKYFSNVILSSLWNLCEVDSLFYFYRSSNSPFQYFIVSLVIISIISHISLINKYLLNTYNMLGTGLMTENTSISKRNKKICFRNSEVRKRKVSSKSVKRKKWVKKWLETYAGIWKVLQHLSLHFPGLQYKYLFFHL